MIIYSNAAKNARLQIMADLVAAKVPAASTGAASQGVLAIGTSALSGSTGLLVAIPLPAAPFTVANGVATLAGTPLSANATGAGAAAKAELRDSNGNVVVAGLTVGTSGTDIVIGSTAISPGIIVQVNAGTITHG